MKHRIQSPQLPAAAINQPTRARLRALAISFSVVVLGAAGPAAEYGPQVEAAYLERCEGAETRPSAAACRNEMERVQAQLGYEGFLEVAGGTVTGSATSAERNLAALAP